MSVPLLCAEGVRQCYGNTDTLSMRTIAMVLSDQERQDNCRNRGKGCSITSARNATDRLSFARGGITAG